MPTVDPTGAATQSLSPEEYSCPSSGVYLPGVLTSTEDLATAIAAGGKLSVVAVAAVDVVRLRAELLVHQGHSALGAQEAGLMPVLVLVRQILERPSYFISQLIRTLLNFNFIILRKITIKEEKTAERYEKF